MGKRSDFTRIDKDQYFTIDKRAVQALVPFLDEGTRFVEPFAGAGHLIDDLTSYGHICDFACDIDPKRADIRNVDAFDIRSLDRGLPCSVISNPPWSRKILHRAIEHFANLAPTWFLYDSDWLFTKQSGELVRKYLTDVVPVGRLIWIPDTKMQSKDSCAWYRFSTDKNEVTYFHGR